MANALESRFGRALKPSEFSAGKLARAFERHRRNSGLEVSI